MMGSSGRYTGAASATTYTPLRSVPPPERFSSTAVSPVGAVSVMSRSAAQLCSSCRAMRSAQGAGSAGEGGSVMVEVVVAWSRMAAFTAPLLALRPVGVNERVWQHAWVKSKPCRVFSATVDLR